MNRRMKEKLDKGDALDIAPFDVGDGHYHLPNGFFEEDVDYCDMKKQRWMWSIGRRKSDGQIVASLSGDLYQNKDYECIWLR